jgi:hypothetical protein
MKQVKGSAGGKARGVIQRQEALRTYHANPNKCLNCSKPILVRDNSTVSETRRKKYCNHSCATRYNNRINHKSARPKESICMSCGITIILRRASNGSYIQRKYCNPCAQVARNNARGLKTPNLLTKGQLFSSAKYWQSARNQIRVLGQKAYVKSGKPLICAMCAYDKHIDICHMTPVSKFPDNASIATINSLDNLIALCPNHHWELDHRLISPK